MDRPIVTRAEAKEQGQKRYFTGVPCKYEHVAERFTANGSCCECARLKGQTAEAKAYMVAYREEHAEKHKAYLSVYREEHAERLKSQAAAYRQSDKYKASRKTEGRRAAGRLYARTSRTTHPHKGIALNVAKHYPAAIVPLTEAERSRLRWFYATARELTKRTGREYHVDHSFPLALGGIHHPLNLMILPGWVNQKKSNKYLPDSPLAVRGMQLKDRLSLRIQTP